MPYTEEDYMLEAFGINKEQSIKITSFVTTKLMNKYSYRPSIIKEIKCSDLNDNEKQAAFYIWGANEGYDDGVVERANWDKGE